jgi:hypothetical protein
MPDAPTLSIAVTETTDPDRDAAAAVITSPLGSRQVGEFLRLTAISNYPITSITWTVPGELISGAVQRPGLGFYLPLVYFTANPLIVSWLNPGQYVVTANAVTTNGPVSRTHVIPIIAPLVTSFVSHLHGGARVVTFDMKPYVLRLVNQVNPSLDGVTFEATIQRNGATGYIGFLQLASNQRFRMDTVNHGHDYSINDQWVLDNGANPTSIIYRSAVWPLTDGQVINTSDGPGGELAYPTNTLSIGVDPLPSPERYRLFVVFLPLPSNPENTTMWVPLQELAWSWGGAARISLNPPGYVLSDPGTLNAYNSVPVTQFAQLPSWTTNTLAGTWL